MRGRERPHAEDDPRRAGVARRASRDCKPSTVFAEEARLASDRDGSPRRLDRIDGRNRTSTPSGAPSPRSHSRGRLALLAALLRSARGAAAPAAAQVQPARRCPPGLAPAGAGPDPVHDDDPDQPAARTSTPTPTSTRATGGLGGRIRPQDIFVINTRFEGSASPADDARDRDRLADQAPHRLPLQPDHRPERAELRPAGARATPSRCYDHPARVRADDRLRADGLERRRGDRPGRPPWSYKYKTALAADQVLGRAASRRRSPPTRTSAAKRAGLVPIDVEDWNFGEIAQEIDKKNRRLGGRHLGPLSVQTQDSCANGGRQRLRRPRPRALSDQYKYKFDHARRSSAKGKKRKITIRRKIKKKARPNRGEPRRADLLQRHARTPARSMALTKTSPATADACVARRPQAGRRRVLLLRLRRLDAAAVPAADDGVAAAAAT